jgi:hypothetical protein
MQTCHIGFELRGRPDSLGLRYPSRLMRIRERLVALALLELLKRLG